MVVVELKAVKFCRVVEPIAKTLARVARPEVLSVVKVFNPVKALLSARIVDEAAVIVMSVDPLKEVPLMFLAV